MSVGSSWNLGYGQASHAPFTADRAVGELIHALARLLAHANPTSLGEQVWEQVDLILASLPLDTEEFASSKQRLANARSYLQRKELGAARYELRLLQRRFDCRPL